MHQVANIGKDIRTGTGDCLPKLTVLQLKAAKLCKLPRTKVPLGVPGTQYLGKW